MRVMFKETSRLAVSRWASRGNITGKVIANDIIVRGAVSELSKAITSQFKRIATSKGIPFTNLRYRGGRVFRGQSTPLRGSRRYSRRTMNCGLGHKSLARMPDLPEIAVGNAHPWWPMRDDTRRRWQWCRRTAGRQHSDHSRCRLLKAQQFSWQRLSGMSPM